MSHTLGIRQAQKQKTRQSLLDAALGLLEGQSLSSLGLREVTRAVGVAPTAFYRHFRSIADLGVALVEEALGSLHPMIRTTVSTADNGNQRITRAIELIARHVEGYPAHVRFIARERHGGVEPVREAIRDQLARFGEEVKAELAKDPESAGWNDDDLLMLANLYVDQMLITASLFLETLQAPEEERERVAQVAERQMRLISIGRRHWLD
ncbi:TetR-family transcriptional regulator [Streptomyces lincolnensis]|jgi:AcrR family transcriptional regulator|uniref:TetR-family transcriptional regulator n=1 Tax=Streptomyces lincolnensis TaxID=1915 RepID=A0A1B1MHQ1_STRLN|nr:MULTISPECIES: TetR family transcriptional regulator [Streptomyces]ANS68139.1 TetR-family transcriptional regulator [Streptomyces lincolnensis]AXG53655.1 TetR-family transcriptional regulator [Streptomyces lincolnensis]MCD7444899.1 TetR family transcriptional regulator [Streptomyces lincolnensis]QMV09786.1 TetR family transcriptional regulator [Streptomyces lincolnensis]WLW52047.1 TetR family transcriptional regulator [Streptomyces coralus]